MYGVIDIGSNTIRLSIYKRTDTGFRLILNEKSMAGLAGYVNKHGNLTHKGTMKAVEVLKSFEQILQNIDVKTVFVFATASLRNIRNTQKVIEKIKACSGYDVDVVSGEQEAIYSYTGASLLMAFDQGILIDIGGGSTELVFYKNKQIEKALSMPIGSLNLYNRHVGDILPSTDELAEIKRSIKAEMGKLEVDNSYQIIFGVGGTARGTCKLCNAICDAPVNNRTIEVNDMRDMLSRFNTDRTYAVKKIIKILPDRIHTIIPGMAILDCVAKQYRSEKIIVCEYGVREGYLYTKLLTEGVNNDGECNSGQEIYTKQGIILA